MQQIAGADVCLKCEEDCVLSKDLMRCVEKDKSEKNCAAWTTQNCIFCGTDATLQSNIRNVPNIAEQAFYETTEHDANNGSFYTNNFLHIFTSDHYFCTKKEGETNAVNNENTELTSININIQNCFYQNSYTGQCEICDEGYAIDELNLVCSRIIDHCEEYDSSFECKKCEKNYIRSIDMNGSHY